MTWKLKDIRWHAKYNPWFQYVLDTLQQVKLWWKMTRKQLTEELRIRKMPLMWNHFNRIGQIHRLIAHDFKPRQTSEGEVSAKEFWCRYLESTMADPAVWEKD